ncbi:MAG: alanine--tRNA ligase [Bacteroidia bacterium]|nr:alanine--tRNA ligase [Bacteroidia bacterium]
MWSTAQVRQTFLDFFAQKDHLIVPSAPLVNKNDPTLFFINAGMNPFKDVFMGFKEPPAPRVADTQKCLRVSGKHNDLEEVGHDTYHHTFFEMLGNWSFGDYFKAEAIAWAWELLTQVYRLPKERLYITVFGGDEEWGLPADQETFELWQRFVPAERIQFFGKKDNFWEMGDTGPCGPCTEIHIDLRPNPTGSAAPLINTGNPQVIELWNLVFIQYNRRSDGSLENLPLKSVDTGMGLERLAMALQGKKSTYDIDIFESLRRELTRITGQRYGTSEMTDIAIRVVCDHIRAVAFAIADGQLPGNIGAGYILRRLLRRAVRYGYQYLGQQRPFLHALVPPLAQLYAPTFPELSHQIDSLQRVIHGEEESFLHTLGRGLSRLENYLHQHKSSLLPGEVAFELYDTYGFPIDLTQLIAREHNLQVDIEGFEQALAVQKARSRQATQKTYGDWIELTEGEHSLFLGYDVYETRSHIVRLREMREARGTFYHVVLDRTPFYPEGGGQVSDTGQLRRGRQALPVIHVYREQDTIVHVVAELPRNPEGEWHAVIEVSRREATSRHHTATHLLHAALREILGSHVQQRGSLVAPDRLRFDFTHPQKLSSEELQEIEELVNSKINAALTRREYRDIPYEEALKKGAIALFGEKYGEKVRMIEFGGRFSRELCGGTHVHNTLDLRFFKIISETAIAAGVRRIEAVVAKAYVDWVQSQLQILEEINTLLKRPSQPLRSLEKTLKEIESARNQIHKWQHLYADELIRVWEKESAFQAEKPVVLREISLPEEASLKDFLHILHKKRPNVTFIVLAHQGSETGLGVAAPESAQSLFQQLAQSLGARGGGNAQIAVGRLSSSSFPLQKVEEILSGALFQ